MPPVKHAASLARLNKQPQCPNLPSSTFRFMQVYVSAITQSTVALHLSRTSFFTAIRPVHQSRPANDQSTNHHLIFNRLIYCSPSIHLRLSTITTNNKSAITINWFINPPVHHTYLYCLFLLFNQTFSWFTILEYEFEETIREGRFNETGAKNNVKFRI
uniref:Uncharacterized protein n=1 Tax=Kalanchoe fedtschenkoi TaxID=63787 RepID=A0A7N0VFR2_KALFE